MPNRRLTSTSNKGDQYRGRDGKQGTRGKTRRGWSTKRPSVTKTKETRARSAAARKQRKEAKRGTTLKNQGLNNYFKELSVQEPNDTIRTPLAEEVVTAPTGLKTLEEKRKVKTKMLL